MAGDCNLPYVRIAILGPGGVGGFLAAALTRAGENAIVVGRETAVRHIDAYGIAVQSARLGEFTVRPAATPRLTEPVDVLLVTTKAGGLPGALERIEAPPSLVVPLLNGVEHMSLLRARFDAVVAGVIRIEVDRPELGRVVQTSPAVRVDLATEKPALAGTLERLATLLEGAGIPAVVREREAEVLWRKLIRLCALACTTSAADAPLGYIRSDPRWRSALEGAINEAAAVAEAEGALIDPAGPLGELEEAPVELGSSMQRDIAAGRAPELDAIAGAVLRAGARHGVRCPTIAWLASRVAERAGIAAPLLTAAE
jgi:2-dehydropantoate 2-reductase